MEGKEKEFELFSSSKRGLGGVLIPVGASLKELNIQRDKEQGGVVAGREWGRNEVIPAGRGSTHLKEEMEFPTEPGAFGSGFIRTGLMWWEWCWEGLQGEHPWHEERGGDQETSDPGDVSAWPDCPHTRDRPDLPPGCLWISIHPSLDMLLGWWGLLCRRRTWGHHLLRGQPLLSFPAMKLHRSCRWPHVPLSLPAELSSLFHLLCFLSSRFSSLLLLLPG